MRPALSPLAALLLAAAWVLLVLLAFILAPMPPPAPGETSLPAVAILAAFSTLMAAGPAFAWHRNPKPPATTAGLLLYALTFGTVAWACFVLPLLAVQLIEHGTIAGLGLLGQTIAPSDRPWASEARYLGRLLPPFIAAYVLLEKVARSRLLLYRRHSDIVEWAIRRHDAQSRQREREAIRDGLDPKTVQHPPLDALIPEPTRTLTDWRAVNRDGTGPKAGAGREPPPP